MRGYLYREVMEWFVTFIGVVLSLEEPMRYSRMGTRGNVGGNYRYKISNWPAAKLPKAGREGYDSEANLATLVK